jgi:DNA-directed RNA polymerase beta subunit
MNKQEQYVLIKSFFKEFGLAPVHIKSFERFVEDVMPRIAKNVEMKPSVAPPGYKKVEIKIENIRIGKPDIKESDGNVRLIYPMEARIRDLTYAAPIIVDVAYVADGEKVQEEEATIGRLPIVVKSKYCNLYGMSREELIKKAREDPDDPGGYFIINGTERLILTTEDLAPNKLIVTKSNQEGIEYVGRIYADAGPIKLPHSIVMAKNGQFFITFGVFKKLHLLSLIKALGIKDDDDIRAFVSPPPKAAWLLEANLMEIGNEQEKINKYLEESSGISTKKAVIANIDNFLLPFIGQNPSSRLAKAMYLMYAMRRILWHWANGTEDDRDSYFNKRVHPEDYNLEIIFATSMKALAKEAVNAFEIIVNKQKRFPKADYIFERDVLIRRLLSSLSTGLWPGNRTGVTQQLSRASFIDSVSYLRRVESLLTSNRENEMARMLHGTHFGRLCAIETPEGPNIGLTKNLALFAYIPTEIKESDRKKVQELIKQMGLRDYELGTVRRSSSR